MSQSVRSITKRGSSRQFKKGSTDLVSGSKTEVFSSISLSAIQRDEAVDLNVIYPIREEIVNNALDECMKRDRERSAIKYVVSCAYEAIKRIIELEFNMHDFGKEDFKSSPAWIADSKPVNSSPDTWAAFTVPVVSTSDDEESLERFDTLVSVQAKASDTLDSSKTYTDQSVEISPPQSFRSLVEQYLVAPHTSEVEIEEYPENDEEFYIKKERSVFTTLMTCSTESNPFTQYSSSLKWKEQSQKLPKMPKINLEKKFSKAPESKISITSLPPLRAEAHLKIMGSFAKEEPKKDSKK